ncbi:MAG: adenylyltransferase/cytidyltransferase family protein [Anaerolineae bacterium]|nr:adenylyltransferase/cytidyltransferase family protein [Anaerolineae bacterium]
MPRKVFVSGCFDMLHSGHVAFLQEAATYGDLYVALGSDATVYELKGRLPINNQDERLYMVQAVSVVKEAFVSSGSGMLDFVAELRRIKPDLFIVNADGNIPQKEALCLSEGIEYRVLQRQPHEGLPARSTTALRRVDQIPYRIDLAGGWLDQPFVSQHVPGPVITISLEPTIAFNERSGMATSTRNAAIDLWGLKLPPGNPEKLAKILFCYDNPPGTEEISGSQDALGIVLPGANRLFYQGRYWPTGIESLTDEPTLQFIEQALYLIPLDPRAADYNPLADRRVNAADAAALAQAAEACWQAVQARDIQAFGTAVRRSFEAQIAMFPHMVNQAIHDMIAQYSARSLGWKLSGAGGGGYLILVAAEAIPNAVRINIRRVWE